MAPIQGSGSIRRALERIYRAIWRIYRALSRMYRALSRRYRAFLQYRVGSRHYQKAFYVLFACVLGSSRIDTALLRNSWALLRTHRALFHMDWALVRMHKARWRIYRALFKQIQGSVPHVLGSFAHT